MYWDEVEDDLKAYVAAQWALSAYVSTFPLVYENETQMASHSDFILIHIEGTFVEKTIYGSVGKRSSIEGGIVFFHCFGETGKGKKRILQPIIAMTQILELRQISSFIDLEGANPPTPVYSSQDELDRLLPSVAQPEGNYYRCSGSVPFIVRSSR